MIGATLERLGFDARTVRVAWTLAVLFALYQIRSVLFLFVVAILLAYMLLPVVDFVDQHVARKRRGLALAVVYLGLLGVLAGLGTTVGTYAAEQASALASRVQQAATSDNAFVIPIPAVLKPLVGTEAYDAKPWLKSHGQQIVLTATGVSFKIIGAAGSALNVIVVLILSFFFLYGGSAMSQGILEMLPDGLRGRVRLVMDDTNLLLAEYMRALVTIALITAVLYGTGLSLLGVPYSILLAVAAFPFEFVPVIGPLISFVVICLVAWFSGYSGILWVAIFILVVRLFQDYVLQPKLIGDGVQLSPLAIMFGVFAGQELAGIAGAVLSVPFMATLRILYRHFVRRPERPIQTVS